MTAALVGGDLDLQRAPHVIVTRFAVPPDIEGLKPRYADDDWLDARHALFRRFFVPSVAPLGVPVVLLCATESAERVSRRVEDLPWAHVEVQDGWLDGWTGSPHQTLTRLDSDDALHRGWFEALERCPGPETAQAIITKSFLRLDAATGRLHRYYRKHEPAPLAAFRGGVNPYGVFHKHLERHYAAYELKEPFLLQVAHGENVSNHRPRFWRFDRKVSRRRLKDFGIPTS